MKYHMAMFRVFLSDIVRHAVACYSGYRIFVHVGAACITVALALSGIDWFFYTETRASWLRPVVYAAGIGGFFMPLLIPLSLYLYSEYAKSAHARLASAAAAQSVIIAWSITAVYKAFTGRVEPEFYPALEMLIDRSRTFNFGFLEYGIYWGWPSSHTAVAFALATALAHFYAGRPFARLCLFLFATLVATGAALGFHWLSDVVAGAIIGSLVGSVVARSMTKHATLSKA